MPALHIKKRHGIQLGILALITAASMGIMAISYMRLPSMLFGASHYNVTMRLATSGGLYPRANVTYLGVEVGQVDDVRLTDNGVEAVLSLRSNVRIPSDLDAQVHSQTAVGEQYVELLPRDSTSKPLTSGAMIPESRTTTPPDVNSLLDATNRGLQAIPGGNLKTVIDESYIAFGGLGPEISRLVKGSTTLAADAKRNLNDLTNLIDNSAALLDTQTDTADAVRAWAAHTAIITGQLRTRDKDLGEILRHAPDAFNEGRRLFDRLQPTLPIMLANLASVAPVLVTYRDDLEQLLVLLPQNVANVQGTVLADRDNPSHYKGFSLNFDLNLNLPQPCNTGFLPPQQMRAPASVDYPNRPAGELYCRVPQDSLFNVRGARNIPCETRPGKRAPTVKLCESNENYVPLNDGTNWKGDPNATFSGQAIPQLPPGAPAPVAPPPPIAVTEYDPATGTYVGPDGKQHRQSIPSHGGKPAPWQDLLLPPKGN